MQIYRFKILVYLIPFCMLAGTGCTKIQPTPDQYNSCFFLSSSSQSCTYKTGGIETNLDDDEDGIDNACEEELKLDPKKSDSDDDGLPDALEIAKKTNPLSASNRKLTKSFFTANYIALCDRDMDGVDTIVETDIGLDPKNPDSDQDGFSDGEEIITGHNPLGTDPVVYQADTTLEWATKHK